MPTSPARTADEIADSIRTLIDRLAWEGIPVTAAAWVKESESGDWYLYLATSLVGEDEATRPAYRRVNAVIREMEKEGFGMDPSAIKVIGAHHPVAKIMIANRRSRPAGPPTPFRGSRLGDLPVDDAGVTDLAGVGVGLAARARMSMRGELSVCGEFVMFVLLVVSVLPAFMLLVYAGAPHGLWGMTAKVRYWLRRPIPVGEALTLRGRLVQRSERGYRAVVTVHLPGAVLAAEGEGMCVLRRPPPGDAAPPEARIP